MRKTKIWYISQYSTPPEFDTHSRVLKFTHYLSEAGYDVTIFSSSYIHNKNVDLIADNSRFIKNNYGGINFVHLKTINYSNNNFLRILAILQFSIKLFILKKKFEKPDIIIHTAHVPFENLVYFTAKYFNAKYIIEVLDLWPESFVAYGLMSKRNPLLRFAYYAEKWLYKRADRIIFSMEGGKDYIIEKKWDKDHRGTIDLKNVYNINNGVDLRDFENNQSHYKIYDKDLENDNCFKIVYIGSIRRANNLRKLIDAAYLLQDHEDVKFLIYGDGNDRELLENYCINNKITNVIFKQKWIELKYVPYVLSKSSLNIINYMPTDVLKYGGSQGKLFQYLASGKPICSNVKMGYCLLTKHNIGISRHFESPQQYADAILSFVFLDKKIYIEMCNRAKSVAQEFDYKALTDKLIEVISSIKN